MSMAARSTCCRGRRRRSRRPTLRSILIEIDESHTDEVKAIFDRGGFTLDKTFKGKHGKDTASRVWYGIFKRNA